MSMFWASEGLRATGDPQDIAYANMLVAIVEARGADIPLPEVADSSEASPHVPAVAGQLAVPGMLELRSAVTDQIEADISEETLAQTNLGNLLGGLRTATVPYEMLFRQQMPSVEDNTQRGMLRKRVREGEISEKVWDYTEKTDEMQVYYRFALKYAQGRERNRLTGVFMHMASQHDPEYDWGYEPAPCLGLGFDDDATIKSIYLSWHQANPIALLRKLEDTQTKALIDDSFVFGNDNRDISTLILRFGHEPSLALEQRFSTGTGVRVQGTTKSTFVYQPADDRFTRHIGNVNLHEELKIANTTELDPTAFTQIAQELLGLIPTTTAEKLYGPGKP